MSRATLAGVRCSHREQEAAIKRAVEVFGEPLSLTTGSSNGRVFIAFESYASDAVWAEHATSAGVHVEALCEYGRPKAISKQSRVWGSSFVRVSLRAAYPFNIYWHEPGTVDTEGNHTKPRLRPFAMHVTVEGGRGYGLGEWDKHRKTLTKWAAEFVNDAARKALLDGVDTANRYIRDWRAGIAAMVEDSGVKL